MVQRIIPGGQNAQDPISNNTMLQRTGPIALKIFQVRNVFLYLNLFFILDQFRWTCNLIVGLIRFRCAG